MVIREGEVDCVIRGMANYKKILVPGQHFALRLDQLWIRLHPRRYSVGAYDRIDRLVCLYLFMFVINLMSCEPYNPKLPYPSPL